MNIVKSKRLWLPFFLLMALSSLFSQNRGTLSLVYHDQTTPFSYRNEETNEMEGLFIDLLEEALHQRLGIALYHQGFSWAWAQRMVREGMADGFCTTVNEERLEYAKVSAIPVLTAKVVLVTGIYNPRMAEIFMVTELEDLAGFDLITYRGNGFSTQNPYLSFMEAPDSIRALDMLAQNRGDILMDLNCHVDYVATRSGRQGGIVKIPMIRLPEVNFFLFLGKNSEFLSVMPEFEKVMAEIREDGTYKQILAKYGIE